MGALDEPDPSVLRALLRPELADLDAYVPSVPDGIEVRLDANEAPPPPREIAELVRVAVSNTPLERYPDPGACALKEAIARRTGARPEELVVGCGSDEVIALLATAMVRPRARLPQPVVLAPTPTFVMVSVTGRAHGWKVVQVPLDLAWDLDDKAMARAVEMVRPNVVYVASPNNPTGNRMSEARVGALLDTATEALVVIDEAYVDYAGASVRAWRARYRNLAILRTLSKVGLAALRVGWVEIDADLAREMDKVRQPFNLSATSQAAATAVLENGWGAIEELVATVRSERARVSSTVAALEGFSVAPSDANFLWVGTPAPAERVWAALVRKGVLVRSFHARGGRLARQLRITIGTRASNDRALEALARWRG